MIAIIVCLFSHDWESHHAAAWLSVVFLIIYMLVFGASWEPVPSGNTIRYLPIRLTRKGSSFKHLFKLAVGRKSLGFHFQCTDSSRNNFIMGSLYPAIGRIPTGGHMFSLEHFVHSPAYV